MTSSQHTTPGADRLPGKGTRTCRYEPCSKEFTPTHPRHEFCEPTCRANQHYVDNPDKGGVLQGGALRSVATQDLDEVRGQGEEGGGDKARYTLITREHITHTLLATGYFNAEDFDALGIPPEHVNVCTSWIGNFSKEKFMEPISWFRSTKPSRKSGKVWIFQITQKGRDELPKLLEDTRQEIAGASAGLPDKGTVEEPDGAASTCSGESGSCQLGSGAGVANPQGPPGTDSSPLSASTASPDSSRPRSSTEEQRTSKPMVAGSTPAGGSSSVTGVGTDGAKPLSQQARGVGEIPGVSADPGDKTLTGAGGVEGGLASGGSSCSGEEIPEGRDQTADSRPRSVDAALGEPTRLFEDSPPSVYDPYSEAA